MAEEEKYVGEVYRLRAGSPMPVANGGFVWHTFMAEKSEVTMYQCTTELPASSDFRGQGGELVSASFSRLAVKGGEYFSGRTVKSPEFVDEDDI